MTESKLMVVGTSHIASQSIKEVRHAVTSFEPDVVAVELDINRLKALTTKQKRGISPLDIFRIGFTGFIFTLVGSYLQKKLGRVVGIEAGADMLEAVKLAKKKGVRIALIDQNIQITMNRLSKLVTFREKFRIVTDIFLGFFFKKREMKKYGLDNLDLTKVPEEELIEKMISMVKDRYPNIHKVLIEERNIFMAKKLVQIAEEGQDHKILAIVGAGHKKDLLDIIKRAKIKKSPQKKGSDFSYSYQFSHSDTA